MAQRNMDPTDWDSAWQRFQDYEQNAKIAHMDIQGVTIGGNDVIL